jgi:hypothetical protein
LKTFHDYQPRQVQDLMRQKNRELLLLLYNICMTCCLYTCVWSHVACPLSWYLTSMFLVENSDFLLIAKIGQYVPRTHTIETFYFLIHERNIFVLILLQIKCLLTHALARLNFKWNDISHSMTCLLGIG